MHRSLSRYGLIGALLVIAVVASACANLPPVMGGTPVPATAESAAAATVTPAAPVGGNNPVNEIARQTLAQQLGVPATDIQVVSTGQVDWPDGCLGIQKPDMMCTQAIVPGYQVILEVNGKQYEVRTDLTGRQVAVAPEGASSAAGQYPSAAQVARGQAAADLGAELGQVQIVSVEKSEWPDACLGVPDPLELCAPALTPGYRVVLSVNGQEVVYRTDETGKTVRREAQPQDASEFPPAAQAAAAALAAELGVPAESITIQRADPAEWTDSCLGLGGPAESCLQAITPGFRVVLESNGEQYFYRTDQSGQVVRQEIPASSETPAAAATPASGGAAASGSEPVIGLRRDVGGACQDVRVDMQGVSFGACGMELASSQFPTDTYRLEQLQDLQKIYASFGVSTPAGKVTFVGQGPVEATPVEQRMVAEWANLVAEEAGAGTEGAGYGLGWRREGGIAGFCDELSVDVAGHAVLRSCKGGAATAGTWKRLTADELTQYYGWLDRLSAVDAQQKDPATADAMTISVVFSGRGSEKAAAADESALLQFGAALLQQWAEATPVRYLETKAEVNIRKGPGEQFDVVGPVAAGQQAFVTAVNADSTWWRVVCPENTAGNCWVTGDAAYTQPVAPAGATGQSPIDETGILAAVVRQVYTVDDTFGGNSKLPLIYLLAVDDGDTGAIPYSSPARPLPAPAQQGVVAALSELPAQFKWVGSAGEVKRNREGAVEGNAAIITVGQVRPQPDGTVQVSASIYVAPLAAGGQTYILERQGDVWVVTGKTGATWIS